MRRSVLLFLTAVLAAGCGTDAAGPSDTSLELLDGATVGPVGFDLAGGRMPDVGIPHLGALRSLPADLALGERQRAAIAALVQRYQQATKADRDLLQAIFNRAQYAAKSGKSREEVRSILAMADPVRRRLAMAEGALRGAIGEVLTAEQKAWLAANQPQRCDPGSFPALSEAQKIQIHGLLRAFEDATRADQMALRTIFAAAEAARQAGATPEEIRAILERTKPILERLEPARRRIHNAI